MTDTEIRDRLLRPYVHRLRRRGRARLAVQSEVPVLRSEAPGAAALVLVIEAGELLPHGILLVLFLVVVEDDLHAVYEAFAVEGGLDGREQFLVGTAEEPLEELLGPFLHIPLLQVINDANVIDHGPVLRHEDIAAKLVKSLSLEGLGSTLH